MNLSIKYILLSIGLMLGSRTLAQDTLFVKQAIVPLLIERQDNALLYIKIDAKEAKRLDKVALRFSEATNLSDIKSVKLYYGGTEARQKDRKSVV